MPCWSASAATSSTRASNPTRSACRRCGPSSGPRARSPAAGWPTGCGWTDGGRPGRRSTPARRTGTKGTQLCEPWGTPMSDATTTIAAPAPPAAPLPTQGMVPSLRTLAPRILIAGILPLVAYSLVRPHLASDAIGLALVSVFPLGDIAVERVRHGRFEPIGMIALVGITAGLISALAFHGDATMLKI